MDKQTTQCPDLNDADLALLQVIEQGAPITADISRADIFICCRLSKEQTLVAYHAMPYSTPSLYSREQTGQIFTRADQPLILHTLNSGSGGRRQRELLRHGAPVFQDVFPILSADGRVIAAFVVETSMIAHERQRRRNRHFRRAIIWLQEMSVRGAIEGAAQLSRFGQYDGVYLVDRHRRIVYMSGNASNLFRTLGMVIDAVGEQVTILEEADRELVEAAMASGQCREVRSEAPDGRVWVRKAIAVRAPATDWLNRWLAQPWYGAPRSSKSEAVDAVVVMVHNATEAVQKQRELNVKAAIIQEVHHRVKNNLQNIASIMRMQARRSQSEEARQQLLDAVNRVLSMAVIHEFMGENEQRAINLREVCQRIAAQVVDVSSTPNQEIRIQVHGPNIHLPASQATPAALVVNELVLNAVEHGVGSRPRGQIDITLTDLGDGVEVTVDDDGAGLPPDFHPVRNASLGLQIVNTLATDDLKGALRLASRAEISPADDLAPSNGAMQGAHAVVTFPKRPLGVD